MYYNNSFIKNNIKRNKKNMFKNMNRSNDNSNTKSFNLSKAYKKEVLEYVSDLTNDVNKIKSSVINLSKSFKSLSYDLKYKGEEKTKTSLKNELNEFITTANSLSEFSKETETSQHLIDYFNKLENILKNNKEPLKTLGIKIKKGIYEIDEETFENNSNLNLYKNIDNFLNIFSEINLKTNDILNLSVSEHMNFKDFSYYFNYSLGTFEKDSFNVIGTGNLIDLAL